MHIVCLCRWLSIPSWIFPWYCPIRSNVTKNKRQANSLAFIKLLRPITYNLDITSLNADLDKNRPQTGRNGETIHEKPERDQAAIHAKESIVYAGFVAQEVESAAKSLGFDFSGVDAPANADGFYSLRYAEFVVPLVKAVQEQQAIIENQQKQIDELKKLVEKQMQR